MEQEDGQPVWWRPQNRCLDGSCRCNKRSSCCFAGCRATPTEFGHEAALKHTGPDVRAGACSGHPGTAAGWTRPPNLGGPRRSSHCGTRAASRAISCCDDNPPSSRTSTSSLAPSLKWGDNRPDWNVTTSRAAWITTRTPSSTPATHPTCSDSTQSDSSAHASQSTTAPVRTNPSPSGSTAP